MGYQEDLRIDKYALDTEWVHQPQLFCRYAELFAQAQYEYEESEEEVKRVAATVDNDIRRNPEKYGYDKKPTDDAIKKRIVLDKSYTDAVDKMLKAKRNMTILLGAKQAFDHRKKALESLVSLHNGQYYADPKEPKVSREVKERVLEQKSARMKEALQTGSAARRLRGLNRGDS